MTGSPSAVRFEVEYRQSGIRHLRSAGFGRVSGSLLDRYEFLENLELDSAPEPGTELAVGPDGALRFGDRARGTLEADADGWKLRLRLAPGERLVGGGDRERTRFLLNGQKGTLWLRYPVQHLPVPLILSDRGYALFVNTTRQLKFNISGDAAVFGADGELPDLYWIAGGGFDDLIDRYTRLTGRPALPPFKSFGLWLLLQTWSTGNEAMLIAQGLRNRKIPCDNIGLEPGWMENYYDATADKDWCAKRFRGCDSPVPWRGGPNRLIEALQRLGFNLGLWLCSRWDYTYEEERRHPRTTGGAKRTGDETAADGGPDELAGLELTHFDPNVGHAPIYLDETTRRDEPWFEHLKKFADDGVRFFKLDPAWLINEFPDRLYGNGRTDREMHNLAFLLAVRQTWRDYEAYTGKRAFGIAVAGWAGSQRFPGTWAGDTGGGPQAVMGLLQDAVIGHAFTTCDLAVSKPEGIHAGFLLPWALLNSWAAFNYPGMLGDELDGIIRDYAELRNRLALYLYSLAERAARTGRAILRPLFMEFPGCEWAWTETREYLLGDALLVTIYRGATVRLPPGRWYDWWTGEIHTGTGDEIEIPVPGNRGGHLFLREGALLPLTPVTQSLDCETVAEIEWRVFPGPGETVFELYLDDGDTLAHRSGAYARQPVARRGADLEFGEITGDQPERLRRLRHTVVDVTASEARGAAQTF